MRVIPLTSFLSHKGRGSRTPNLDDTVSLDVRELFKHTLKRPGIETSSLCTQVPGGPKLREGPSSVAAVGESPVGCHHKGYTVGQGNLPVESIIPTARQ